MPEYRVTLPIAGSVSIVVQAADENIALETALDMDWLEDIRLMKNVELESLDTYEKLFKGNIIFTEVYEAEVEKNEVE